MLNTLLYYAVLPMLMISVVLVFVRFVRGPRLSDRVISLDLLITIGIGIIAIYSIIYEHATFLDIAMILALIAFLSTVAFTYYLEKREKDDN